MNRSNVFTPFYLVSTLSHPGEVAVGDQSRPCASILPGDGYVHAEFPIAPLPLYSVTDFSPFVQGSMFGSH